MGSETVARSAGNGNWPAIMPLGDWVGAFLPPQAPLFFDVGVAVGVVGGLCRCRGLGTAETTSEFEKIFLWASCRSPVACRLVSGE